MLVANFVRHLLVIDTVIGGHEVWLTVEYTIFADYCARA